MVDEEATMPGHAPWASYTGSAEILLLAVLAAAAAAVAYAGMRLPLPARLPRPGRAGKIMLLGAWMLAIVLLLVSVAAYMTQVHRAGLEQAPAEDSIAPVTLICVIVLFAVIAVTHRERGWGVALGSAVIGAIAAPWIFEVPFDLAIMPRAHIAVDPDLYRLLLFGALILVGVTTLALLSLSPVVRVQRATLWCLAGMLALFAVWGLFGFGYPSAPGPTTLNVLSKILAFVTALTLFLPERNQAGASRQAPAVASSNVGAGLR
jgi:hypothetical protein